ncbi:uncharacterized protein LOC107018894 [Solanum pennellii]|uniref:Uncharacterized protein LOC107018894 n=1 Tax=Solanum pennellii TaxID=28526 RepID=A0ABM1GRU0_SOLPN|nr:uncharacterized protein LOC107018894 [Solanum pennellii]
MSFASTENCIPVWRQILNSTLLVLRSHSLHFHALSIMFLWPIIFSLIVYPSFYLAFFHPDYNFIISTQFSISSFEIFVTMVCALFFALFFLCSIATITYSTVQAYKNRPMNLISSIKSIRSSFFPLLSTFIVSHAIFISVIIIIALVFVVLLQILKDLGLIELQNDSNHFWFLFILVIVPVLLWLQVNWSLAYAIAAVESKWGFETLRRSAYLVKGMRWVAFWTHLFYGLSLGAMVIGSNVVFVILGVGKGDHWRSFSVTSQVVQCTVLGTLGMNQFLVLNAVLYMYCKDLEGEKLSFEDVSVPLDEDEKNHNIV